MVLHIRRALSVCVCGWAGGWLGVCVGVCVRAPQPASIKHKPRTCVLVLPDWSPLCLAVTARTSGQPGGQLGRHSHNRLALTC